MELSLECFNFLVDFDAIAIIDSAQCPLTCSGLPLELPKTTPAWFCFFSLLCIITAWPFFFHKGGKVILKK